MIFHVKLHDNTSPCFCDSCRKIYGNVLAFNEHVRRYHFKEFPCSQCDQKFTANVALKRHMRIHNKSSDNFPCDVCSKTFSRLDSLKRHKVENCNATRAEFSCDICHEFLSSKRMLDRHMNLHHEQGKEGIHTCEICTKVFDNFFPYMQHKKRDTPKRMEN